MFKWKREREAKREKKTERGGERGSPAPQLHHSAAPRPRGSAARSRMGLNESPLWFTEIVGVAWNTLENYGW